MDYIKAKLQGKIEQIEHISGFRWISYARPPMSISAMKRVVASKVLLEVNK